MLDMLKKDILPACVEYRNELGKDVEYQMRLGMEVENSYSGRIFARETELSNKLYRDVNELETVLKSIPDGSAYEKACYYRDKVLPLMKSAREKADELETITDRKYWPIPVYRELLFGVD